jgi:type I restriction enzyme, S subunit
MSKTKQKSMEELLEEALVPEEEQPYEVLENWIWTRLGNLVQFIGGGTPSKTVRRYWDGNIPWATVKDIKGKYLLQTKDSITEEGLNNSSASLAEEEELIVVTRMSPGKAIISKIKTAINQDLKIVKPKTKIHAGFLWIFFEVNRPLIESLSTGSTVKGIQINKLDELLISLPPYEEQKRIAEKIERLFAKIDEAKRLIEEVKESFELRRAAILDKAFKGQLGTNDPDEKSMLEISDVITEKDLIPEEEQLYEVPENWVWVKAGDITDIVGGGTPKTTVKEYYENGDIPWITPADLSDFEDIYISRGQRNITKEGLKNSSAKLLPEKTVLLSSRAPIGYVAIAANPLSTNQGFKSFIPSNVIDSEYLYWYLKRSRKYLESMGSGSTFKEISASRCKEIKIPLPPINEQKRIAEKLSNLLSKLDNEKKLVLDFEEKINLLKQSILYKAFHGELGTNDPTDEHAIELLKEVLKSK